uniref:Uncharacterized protein n=1 Tax=Cannabis sativa TaxID=3483 RepID=A0A803PZB8_CANSA
MGLLNRFLGNIQSRFDKVWEIAKKDGFSTSLINLTEHVLMMQPLREVPFENSRGDNSDYDKLIVINKKWLGSSNDGAHKKPYPALTNKAEMMERLHPRVGIDVSPFLADVLDQSATTSYRLGANRFAMMVSRDPIYVADTMRTQANVVSLIAERNYSMVTLLAYKLNVLRVEHENSHQKREEVVNALGKANTKMEAIIKQRVIESLHRALTRKKIATKMERERGDKYKDLHSVALTKVKDLEADSKQAKLDMQEKDQKLTILS